MELLARWALDRPFTPSNLLAATNVDTGALDAEAASNDWALAYRGGELELTVGPLTFARAALNSGLDLFHHLHNGLEFAVPADLVGNATTGVRLTLPGGSPGRATLETVAELCAPLLVPVLDSMGAGSVRIQASKSGIEITLDRPVLPEVFDELAPLFAATTFALARDVQWGIVPAEITARPDWVRITNDGVAVLEAAYPDNAGAAPVLRQVSPVLDQLGRRGQFEGLLRLLPEGSMTPQPAPPRMRAEPPPDLQEGTGATLDMIPFRPGARPIDEIAAPGSGCSEFGGFLSSGDAEAGDDEIFVLFRLNSVAGEPPPKQLRVVLSAAFVGPDGSLTPVPGMRSVNVPGQLMDATAEFEPTTVGAPYELDAPWSWVALIDPQAWLFPGPDSWKWENLPPAFRARTPDGQDPYTFANLFHQRVRLTFTLIGDDKRCDTSQTDIEVYDLQRFGSLYGRLLQLVADDIREQKRALGVGELYAAHHPWYPVLGIGMNKADLYMRAIRQDVAQQTKHLASPRWLLRVGIFLELLTCCGIFEALRNEHPNLMSPEERDVLHSAPQFEELRGMLDTDAWREVWDLHEVVLPRTGVAAAGPVAFQNLMRKQQATLKFLHTHHQDLKNAIELAGPHLDGAQEAWHRVYRDAERAVVNSSLAAFPELRHLPAKYREFSLWHQKGDFQAFAGGKLLPVWLTAAFGDQDGVYPAGARQYRASMNEVAEWCRTRHLMDHAGTECVPRSVSLIEALLDGDDDRFASLQARDGYGGSMQAMNETVRLRQTPSPETVEGLLRAVPVFAGLDSEAVTSIAGGVTRGTWVPGEDIVVQGDGGASMFLIESGLAEVVIEQHGRTHITIAQLGPGNVFGEMALLTGQPRAATVRAVHYTTTFEIRRNQLEPLLQANRAVVNEMSAVLAVRRAELDAARGEGRRRAALRERILSYFQLDNGQDGKPPPAVALEARASLLAQTKVFEPLSVDEAARLARLATAVEIPAGADAVVEGERGASLFVIVEGQVEVVRDGARIATLGVADSFGEMALLTGERRSATVRAIEPTVLLELGKSDLFPVISNRPGVILELSEQLAARQEAAADQPDRRRDKIGRRIRSFFLG